METRKLHNLTVSEVGMGCMAFHAPALLPKTVARLLSPRLWPKSGATSPSSSC